MKCSRLFGHNWSRWGHAWGGATKHDAGVFRRQMLQERTCKTCNFIESKWTEKFTFAHRADENEIEQKEEDKTA